MDAACSSETLIATYQPAQYQTQNTTYIRVDIYIYICYLLRVIMSLLMPSSILQSRPNSSYFIRAHSVNSWFDSSDWLNKLVFCENHSYKWDIQFKALMYWWKLASTIQKEKHLFSTCSITGKVARCVLSDGKCTVRVQWREMCDVQSGWRCIMRDEWLVFYRACSGSGSVVQHLLSGWKCAVHVEWLEMCSVCSVTGKVAWCVFSDWKVTARAEWLEIYSACSATANCVYRVAVNLQCMLSDWKFTLRVEWLEMLYSVR